MNGIWDIISQFKLPRSGGATTENSGYIGGIQSKSKVDICTFRFFSLEYSIQDEDQLECI